MRETPSDQLRIGLIATDPLRVLGLQTIFAEDGRTEVISLSVPGALDASGVSLILSTRRVQIISLNCWRRFGDRGRIFG